MEFSGTVLNGAIILDGPQSLPEGTKVKVVVPATQPTADNSSLRDFLLSIAGSVPDWPADMAVNHDHYLHGAPKQTDDARHD